MPQAVATRIEGNQVRGLIGAPLRSGHDVVDIQEAIVVKPFEEALMAIGFFTHGIDYTLPHPKIPQRTVLLLCKVINSAKPYRPNIAINIANIENIKNILPVS